MHGGRPRLHWVHGALRETSSVEPRAHEKDVTRFDADPLRPLRGLEVFGHHPLPRLEPLHAAGARDVQEHTAAHHAVVQHLDGVDGGALARGDQVARPAVVELAVPEVVRGRVDVRDVVPVEDHADELGGAATLEDPLVGVVIAALTGVDHEAHRLHGGVGGQLGAPGAGAGHAHAIRDEPRSRRALLRGDQVEGAELVILAPAAPVGQGAHVLAHLRFRGDGGRRRERHATGYFSSPE